MAATTAAARLQYFLSVSPIHGCSNIANRRNIAEALFWLMLLLVCVGLCIRDTVNLVSLYLSVPLAISVDMQRNQTMHFANGAICFDVVRSALSASIERNFNETTFNASIGQEFGNQLQPSNFNPSNLSTTDPALDMLMKSAYLHLLSVIEFDLGFPVLALYEGLTYSQNVERAVALAMDFFTRQNYTVDVLLDHVTRYMCKQAVDNKHANNFWGANNCNTMLQPAFAPQQCIDICGTSALNAVLTNGAFSNNDDVCFSLNSEEFQLFGAQNDQYLLENIGVALMSRLVNDWEMDASELSQWNPQYGGPKILLDMRGWESVIDTSGADSLEVIQDSSTTSVGIELISQFFAYNKSASICMGESSASCTMNCIATTRFANDGCWPLFGIGQTASARPVGAPVCSHTFTDSQALEVAAFMRANSLDYMNNTWKNCFQSPLCSRAPCETDSYQFKVTSVPSGGGNGSSTTMTLYASRTVFPVFTQYVSMDVTAFLANFGGLIGLWFGGSIIAMVHLPVVAVSIASSPFTRRCCKKCGEPCESKTYCWSITSG